MTARNKKGFTLIELLIVIVIIGVLAGVSLPAFKKTASSLEFNSFLQTLQSYIGYLRQYCLTQGKVMILNIDNQKKQYWAHPAGEQKRLKTYNIPGQIDVKIISDDISAAQAVIFYPDGRIGKADIELTGRHQKQSTLTTEGVFGKAKIKTKK